MMMRGNTVSVVLMSLGVLVAFAGTACFGLDKAILFQEAGFCGDGGLDRGEECDDGNARSGDGCSAACRRELTAGGAHTCVVLDEERVQCWGLGSSGQLGQGSHDTIGDDEPGLVKGVHIGGKVEQIAVGGGHTCALLETGAVRCWGSGRFGRLGYGNERTLGDDEHPASAGDVDVGAPSIQVVAGGSHTCVLLAMGAVRCWGDDGLRYGDRERSGDDEHPSSAGDVDIGGAVIELAAGDDHTCALLEAGAVRCWGFGRHGRLGYGDEEEVGYYEPPALAGNVDVGGRVSQITAGGEHTCALMETGAIRCWGEGENDRLGYGNPYDIGDNEHPSSAGDMHLGGKAVQVAAGDEHTCALMDNGAVRCWGEGEDGRLGYGERRDVDEPSKEGDVNLGGKAIQVVVGDRHTCALMKTGRVRCWGSGEDGRLGYGNTEDIGDDGHPASAGDVDLGGEAIQLAAGGSRTCALMKAGVVRCWGAGLLGYGSRTIVGDDEVPRVEVLSHGGVVVQLVAGSAHTCVLLDTGTMHCWGKGTSGQHGYGHMFDLGDDEASTSLGNVRVGGVVQQLATGDAHTCALLDSGEVRCWGDGRDGRLGRVSTASIGDTETPDTTETLDLDGIAVQIEAGAKHTCALLEPGAVRCWGSNEHGQLGLPGTGSIGDDEPPAVAGDVRVGGAAKQLAVGGFHTCALLESGEVRCWGRNDAGQLGMASTETVGDDEEPGQAAAIELGGAARQISAGDAHTCALLDTGAVRCWGDGGDGRLGHGDIQSIGDDEHPADVGDVALGGPAIAVAAGAAHTCVMLQGGAVVCWGLGQDGRLGRGNLESLGDDEAPATAGPIPVP